MSEPTEVHDQVQEANTRRRMPEALRRYMIRMQGGKMYLPAAYRVVWFRDELGDDWGIRTSLVEGGHGAGFACVRAEILNPSGQVVSCGHKTETKTDFPAGWVEKAESGSIARALAHLGFGTQFTAELDDAHEAAGRLADSPQAARACPNNFGDAFGAASAPAQTAPPVRQQTNRAAGSVGHAFAAYKGWCARHGLDGEDAPLCRFFLSWALDRPITSRKDVSATEWTTANGDLARLQPGAVQRMVAEFAGSDALMTVAPDPAPNAVAAGR